MKNIRLVLAGLLLASPLAFAGPPKKLTPVKGDEKAAAKPAAEGDVIARGEKLKGAPAVALADLLSKPADYAGKTVTVDATIRRACEKKGCWMELSSNQADKGPAVRVTFKDYAFFVPTDSAGRKAKVEGVVKVAQLSEDHAKHYEAEGATVPRGSDGKPTEVQLEATGVELRK